MDLMAAIRREERRVETELRKLKGQLNGLRTAAKALGDSAGREATKVKKRVLSASARAKISEAARRRWAKVKAGAKKAAS